MESEGTVSDGREPVNYFDPASPPRIMPAPLRCTFLEPGAMSCRSLVASGPRLRINAGASPLFNAV
jgi:hypothetical protein